jgi:hypothetical protein
MRQLFLRIRDFFARLFGGSSFGDGRPTDPHAGVREPRRGKPRGGGSAVALVEPDDEREAVNAVGRRHSR